MCIVFPIAVAHRSSFFQIAGLSQMVQFVERIDGSLVEVTSNFFLRLAKLIMEADGQVVDQETTFLSELHRYLRLPEEKQSEE